VLDELVWQPGLDESDIGVTVRGGFETLAGHVKSYAEKFAADKEDWLRLAAKWLVLAQDADQRRSQF
jgi:hypothetical protein